MNTIVDTLNVPDSWPYRRRAALLLNKVPPGYTSMIFHVPSEPACTLYAHWLLCYDCGLRWREWRLAADFLTAFACGPCPAATPECMPRFTTKQPTLARLGGLP